MKKPLLIIFGVFCLLYLVPLGMRPIFLPDESRYAEIPREMIANGDWIVPRLNGLRYFEKPILGYWLNAVSMLLFGENAFAIRLPAALSAGISALMVFLLTAADGLPALLAALIYLINFEVYILGTASTMDSPVSMLLTVAMGLFFLAYKAEDSYKKSLLLLLFGVFCGFAFLTKGFLGFVVPVVTIVPFMIWERKWQNLFKLVWLPLASTLIVSAPWSLLIHFREPDYWRYFFWVEHIQRFFSENSAQHPEPVWFFIPVLAIGLLPWTFILPAAFIGAVERISLTDPFIKFLICWFLFPFIFFSVSEGKLTTYILPCFAPAAILIAMGIVSYFEKSGRKVFTVGLLIFTGLIFFLAFALLFLQVTNFIGFKVYDYSETGKWVWVFFVLLLWCGMMILAIRLKDPKKSLALYGLAPLLAMLSAQFALPLQITRGKSMGDFFQQQAHKVQPDTVIISERGAVGSVCWYFKRQNVYVFGHPGELDYGLDYADAKPRHLTSEKQVRQLIAQSNPADRPIFIGRTELWSEYKNYLPQPTFQEDDGYFVFVRF